MKWDTTSLGSRGLLPSLKDGNSTKMEVLQKKQHFLRLMLMVIALVNGVCCIANDEIPEEMDLQPEESSRQIRRLPPDFLMMPSSLPRPGNLLMDLVQPRRPAAHYPRPHRRQQPGGAGFVRNNGMMHSMHPHHHGPTLIRRVPAGRGKMHQQPFPHQYPRRPGNYGKPLQHQHQQPQHHQPAVMGTSSSYPSSDPPSSAGHSTSSSSSQQQQMDTQQSLLNLQLGTGDTLTYLYLPPASQELDSMKDQHPMDQQAGESVRTPTNTHQEGPSNSDTKLTSEDVGGFAEAPTSFDPYRFRGIKSAQYYEKSSLDSEDEWIPIDSPWNGGSQDDPNSETDSVHQDETSNFSV